MLAVSDNPPVLTESVQDISSLTGTWWVAHTKARCEKALAWDLIDRDIPYFLPMAQKVAFWGGRKRQVLSPVFPSYVFFCGGGEDRAGVFATRRVCQIIEVRQREQFVSELQAVHLALSSKHSLDLYPHAAVGRRCRVAQGPLQGIEGVVIQKNGATHLVLNVSMLGQGACLEISADLLEPA
jgi:transcription antitermination factor NusG